jgi:RNA 3'-terminal phosphate cyclase (ATP)
MVTIDGSTGEGGGQILRTALTLSVATGSALCVQRIRAGRPKPGLLHQHLAAVHAAALISDATVEGAELRSAQVIFRPRRIRAGTYRFTVGTAGSATLVLQTVLPPLLLADVPSQLIVEGGTHNPLAPPFEFVAATFLPVVQRMGPRIDARLARRGFYPAGGGQLTAEIEPAGGLQPIELLTRGAIRATRGRALVANLPTHVGQRELRVVQQRLGWPPACLQVEVARGVHGPANVLLLEVESEHITEVFSAFGERHVAAETVAERAVAEVQRYLAADVPVGSHLADQLLVPFALAGGGTFRTLGLSRHAITNLEVIRAFLPVHVRTQPDGADSVRVELGPSG